MLSFSPSILLTADVKSGFTGWANFNQVTIYVYVLPILTYRLTVSTNDGDLSLEKTNLFVPHNGLASYNASVYVFILFMAILFNTIAVFPFKQFM